MLRRTFASLSRALVVGFAAATLWGIAAAAGLLIADAGLGGVLQIRQHDVKMVVNNGAAVTEVELVFVNKDRVLEAPYTFPVPMDASVANFIRAGS